MHLKLQFPLTLWQGKGTVLQSLFKIQEVVLFQGHSEAGALQRRNSANFPYNVWSMHHDFIRRPYWSYLIMTWKKLWANERSLAWQNHEYFLLPYVPLMKQGLAELRHCTNNCCYYWKQAVMTAPFNRIIWSNILQWQRSWWHVNVVGELVSYQRLYGDWIFRF